MNTKTVKKIRKNTKDTFILFLRERPKFLPMFVWRLCALAIFNDSGLKLVGAFYDKTKTITIRGVKYKIKN